MTENEDGLAGMGIKLTLKPTDVIKVEKDSTDTKIPTAEFTNDMEVVSASVQKIWKDENNTDGKRPLKLIVHLKARGKTIETVELSASTGWMKTIRNLPKCDEKGEIEYTWEEDTPSGYTLESTNTVGTLTTLTNVFPPEKTSISVHKVWDDQNNVGGTRQDEIKVQLFADGKAEGDPVPLNAGNGWSYTWKDLTKNCNPSGEAGGSRAIVYTVEEIGVPSGYQVAVSGNAQSGFEITNSIELGKLEIRKRFKYEPAEEEPDDLDALVSIPVLKVWDDNENKDQNRPESITVRLYAGGEEIDSVKLNEANGWAHTFKDLPKYKNNKTIRYSVTEDPVEMYTTQISGSAESGFSIVNQYSPQVTSVMVRKVWDDNDNEMLIRPTSIRMTLSNGMNVILNEANGWTAVVNDLPAIVDGKPAAYTWTEQEVPGYKLESKSTTGTVTTFTNRAVKLVKIPADQPQPRMPGGGWVIFEEYDTALGGELLINHVGDCFD